MKPKTRDNIIYLTVGLGIAALVCIDAFYSLNHNREMWMPSPLAFRAVYTTALLWYFIIRTIRKTLRASFSQILAAVLLATLIHVGLMFHFRDAINQAPGLTFSAWATLELAGIVWSLLEVFRYLLSVPYR